MKSTCEFCLEEPADPELPTLGFLVVLAVAFECDREGSLEMFT